MQLRNRDISQNTESNLSSCEGDTADSTGECFDQSDSLNRTFARSLLKQALSRKIFVGEYTERRYVKPLTCYRDIIVIEHDEQDIIKGLKKIQKVAQDNYNNKWLGITTDTKSETEINYCLWVELEKLTLGKYWFKVNSVIIRDQEIILQLKIIRSFETKAKLQSYDISTIDVYEVFNWTNFWELLKFSAILIVTIVTCLINALPYIAEYILKFMRELNHTLHVLTPMVLGGMEIIQRCIGGFYWMIIMLFKSPSSMPRPMPAYPPLTAKTRQKFY